MIKYSSARRSGKTCTSCLTITFLALFSLTVSGCKTLRKYEFGTGIKRQVVLTKEQQGALADIDWNLAYQAAFAVNPDGAYGYAAKRETIEDAEKKAIEYCQRNLEAGNLLCKVHTVNGNRVISDTEIFNAASQAYEFGDVRA